MTWFSEPIWGAARREELLVVTAWSPEELLHGASSPAAGEGSVGDAESAVVNAIEREAEARIEIERRVREAYEEGFEEGRTEGEIAEGARLRAAIAAAEDALEEIRAGESRWRDGLEENICALAVAVARQLVDHELRSDPRSVVELVRRAMTEFRVDQPIRIRVAPSDLALIAANGSNEPPEVSEGRDARWLADPLITPGGCVVEGRDRIIDGRVDTALERMYRRLTHTHA